MLDLKYTILIYLIILSIFFLIKPNIFKLSKKNKKRKLIYLIALIIIISIICFYFKILIDWYF
jgi:hypothetical protein